MKRCFLGAIVLAGVLAGTLLAGSLSADDLERVFELARDTLALVERSEPQPRLAAELAEFQKEFAEAQQERRKIDREMLYRGVRELRRRIILSHPLLDFDNLLINKRTCHIPGHMCDQYLGRHSRPGPGLAVLESWKDNPQAWPLLEGKLPPGSVTHPDLSFDAKRVLFAFCDHSRQTRGDLRAYFIYELDVDSGEVRQLTGGENDSLVGAHGRKTVVIEDYDPCYLPGGGFAFTSTRSQQFGRCHGSRYVPSYILYRADAEGSNIERISFNEANEWDPSVLNDGRIIYCRWDYINRHDTNFQSLWITRPNGTVVTHFYGNYSVGPCMITEARAIPNSHKVVATATDHHGYTAGSIIVIDPHKGEDGGAPLLTLTPEIGFPERGAPQGTSQVPPPLAGDVSNSGRRRAATPYPISEDLFLVAYPHGDRFAIYLIDTLGGRELIYEDPSISCFSPFPLVPRPAPPLTPSLIVGREKANTGQFFVQDVYRSTQPIERGTIERLRVSEIISQPTRSKPILSRVNNEVIKRILGTVPVGPDGSVAFEAPADTALQLQLLDRNGMAVMTMRSLVYLRPGERATCVGCHEGRHGTPGATARLSAVKFQKLKPPAGPQYEGGFSFVRTVQPVLDRYCIDCHGLEKTEAGVNLLGKAGGRFSTSYDSLLGRGKLVVIAQRNGESAFSRPKEYYAHAGRLAQLLLDGHPDKSGRPLVQLDGESLQRIVDWLDLNAQFYGDYSFNRVEDCGISSQGEKALRERIAGRFGPELAAQPFAALVNVALPGESRILEAPLARRAGGWEQIGENGFSATNDPAYKQMLELVEAAIEPLQYHDVAGTCGHENGCRCGCCFARVAQEQRQAERTLDKSSQNVPGVQAERELSAVQKR